MLYVRYIRRSLQSPSPWSVTRPRPPRRSRLTPCAQRASHHPHRGRSNQSNPSRSLCHARHLRHRNPSPHHLYRLCPAQRSPKGRSPPQKRGAHHPWWVKREHRRQGLLHHCRVLLRSSRELTGLRSSSPTAMNQ